MREYNINFTSDEISPLYKPIFDITALSGNGLGITRDIIHERLIDTYITDKSKIYFGIEIECKDRFNGKIMLHTEYLQLEYKSHKLLKNELHDIFNKKNLDGHYRYATNLDKFGISSKNFISDEVHRITKPY